MGPTSQQATPATPCQQPWHMLGPSCHTALDSGCPVKTPAEPCTTYEWDWEQIPVPSQDQGRSRRNFSLICLSTSLSLPVQANLQNSVQMQSTAQSPEVLPPPPAPHSTAAAQVAEQTDCTQPAAPGTWAPQAAVSRIKTAQVEF